jgi:hypothetical protein
MTKLKMSACVFFTLCLAYSLPSSAQDSDAPAADAVAEEIQSGTDTSTATLLTTDTDAPTTEIEEPKPLFELKGKAGPATFQAVAPPNDGGLELELKWDVEVPKENTIALYRSGVGPDGPWALAKGGLKGDVQSFVDKVTQNPNDEPPAPTYWYRLLVLSKDAAQAKDTSLQSLAPRSLATLTAIGVPKAHFFIDKPGHRLLLGLIIAVALMMFWFTKQVRQGHEIKIRRIPGIDAIEEGIGRATEMGKPVLYVPGIDSLEDIQTIASMLILGEVSKTIAEYQADLIVSCCVPIVREVADEVVKSGYFRAGHPDAYDPTSVRFIASEQFAFCAGTNGIMYRQKPATNIYLGRFFAESLILAETGFVNRSIQIAGTAEATQLPFFVAACDYTLIGEELFAVSAYLSNDARLVSALKASDWVKIATVALLVVGVISRSFGCEFMTNLFDLAGG